MTYPGAWAAVTVTLSSALVAFGFAYFRFPLRNVLFGLVLATMMLPGAATMIPVYLIWHHIGLTGTQVPLWGQNLFGSAFYIGANLGAGPRDSLMLVGAARTGTRVGVVRAAIELTALALGFALGGTLGVGTLVFAALIGPSVEGSFWLISRTRAAT